MNQDDRYRERRTRIEAQFTPERREQEERTKFSPTHRYKITISHYTTSPGSWRYARGEIYHQDGRLIADIKRNYSGFWFSWVEHHPNGHDYLLAGEDYQGQTIIELKTGRRVDYFPPEAYNGTGFCWVSAFPSPDKNLLAVEGCIWAGPYELKVVDFTHPMELPYPILATYPLEGEMRGWTPEGNLLIEEEVKVRLPDNTPLSQLTAEERNIVEAENNIGERPVIRTLPFPPSD